MRGKKAALSIRSKIQEQGIVRILNAMHMRMFGIQMSTAMLDFLKHLSWSSVGLAISALTLFSINVAAGRFMGPMEYGSFNYVLSFGYVLTVIIIFGQDLVAIRAIAGSRNRRIRESQKANAVTVITVTGGAVILLALCLVHPVARILSVTPTVMWIAVVYAIIFSYKSICDIFLRAVHAYKAQTFFRLLESAVIAVVFIAAFALFKKAVYYWYIAALAAGFISFCICYFVRFPIDIARIDWKAVFRSRSYAIGALFFTLVMMLSTSIDKLFIGSYLGIDQLGIYSAYATVSILLVSQIIAVMGNAFYPMISAMSDKRSVLKKIDRLSVIFFVPGTAALFGAAFVLLSLFGAAYQKDPLVLIMFSISAYCQLSASFYRSAAIADDRSYRRCLLYSIIALVFFVLLLAAVMLVHADRLGYVVGAYTVYNVLSLVMMKASTLVHGRQYTSFEQGRR